MFRAAFLNYFLLVDLIKSAHQQSAVVCQCRCSWWEGDNPEVNNVRLADLLATSQTVRRDCALALNQSDVARIIDGRSWNLPVGNLRFNFASSTTTPTSTASTTRKTVTSRPSSRFRSYGSDSMARSLLALQPEKLDEFINYAYVSLSTFYPQTNPDIVTVIGAGGPLPDRVSLNRTEQRRLSNILLDLFKRQQVLLMPANSSSSTSTANPRRRRRQATPISQCSLTHQTEACRLLEFVKAGTLFLLPTIPDLGVSEQQSDSASAFANILDMCAGRQARTLTGSTLCIDTNLLNSIGTFSTQYFGQTSIPLTVKSLAGGIFPILASGGSPSILHRYGAAVDFACGMFEQTVPEACLLIYTLCARRAKQLNLPSMYLSLYAENFGCGGSSSYFDSLHCTLGAVDARALVSPSFDPNS